MQNIRRRWKPTPGISLLLGPAHAVIFKMKEKQPSGTGRTALFADSPEHVNGELPLGLAAGMRGDIIEKRPNSCPGLVQSLACSPSLVSTLHSSNMTCKSLAMIHNLIRDEIMLVVSITDKPPSLQILIRLFKLVFIKCDSYTL